MITQYCKKHILLVQLVLEIQLIFSLDEFDENRPLSRGLVGGGGEGDGPQQSYMKLSATWECFRGINIVRRFPEGVGSAFGGADRSLARGESTAGETGQGTGL